MNLWAFKSDQFVDAARLQIGRTLYYDPAYSQFKYPLGDVPLEKGYVRMS